MDRTDVVRAIEPVIRAHARDVVCAYVFGSVARGEAGPSSDVDVAVLLRSTAHA